MIYTVGGIKGGCGKTTTAINLTIKLASDGRDTLLIDADEQESATDFTNLRNQNTNDQAGYTFSQLVDEAVRTQIIKFVDKFDDIVVDTGGRDTTSQRAALTVSDVYLIPFIPRILDMWTLEQVVKLIEEIRLVNPNLQIFGFLNQADARGKRNEAAMRFLKENESIQFIDKPLGHRVAFSYSFEEGKGIIEHIPKDEKAISEFSALCEQLQSIAMESVTLYNGINVESN